MSKRARKAKALVVTKDEPSKLVLIANATYAGLTKTSWEGIYNLLEVEDPSKVEEEGATNGSTDKLDNTLYDLASFFLHRITTRAKVLPYNDLVRWVIESINIIDRAFYTTNGRMFGTFRVEDVKNMYHLLDP